jgi:hypothetical protein
MRLADSRGGEADSLLRPGAGVTEGSSAASEVTRAGPGTHSLARPHRVEAPGTRETSGGPPAPESGHAQVPPWSWHNRQPARCGNVPVIRTCWLITCWSAAGQPCSASHRVPVSQCPGITRSRSGLTSWPRFLWLFHDREDFIVCRDYKPFGIMKSWPGAMPGSHIRLRGLILPAFWAPSRPIMSLWAFTPLIAGVNAHGNLALLKQRRMMRAVATETTQVIFRPAWPR